jgi:exopolyphosphatase/guanosine-5'-triphosphate,3'-diphosphate pyrophosphatase
MPRYAAIDIGSNSVRMLAAEVAGGEIRTLAQERQVTRLGESVFQSGRISEEALSSLCVTLARMAETYGRLNLADVRVVATSAVRDANNQEEFLERAGEAVGSGVEIISGTEEARLIHAGVVARWPRPKETALLIDVGGGSAELIISRDGRMGDAVSRPLGAVRLTQVFLRSDPPSSEELKRMFDFIDDKLLPFQKQHGGEKFDRVIVTSATAGAIVSAANDIPRAKRDEADRLAARQQQVKDLFRKISKASLSERRKITGIGPRRAEIVVAGAAVFLRIMELFNLSAIQYSTAGVREGIVVDLALRGAGMEVAQLSAEQRALMEMMAAKYRVRPKHGQHVSFICAKLFADLKPLHRLPPEAGKLLESAGYLHDIGHFVSNTGHHKHSAYLVANSDMPGFTDRERMALAALCRFHRKSLPQSRHMHFQALDNESKRAVFRLTPLLRLADSLDRSHAQKITQVQGVVANGAASVTVHADSDISLELWSANQVAPAFREVYGAELFVAQVVVAMRP